jgi:signal transduction histidine kinase
MVFTRYSLQIIVRIILILINIFLSIVFYYQPDKILTAIILLLLVFLQTYYLIRYLLKFQVLISDFFDILKAADKTRMIEELKGSRKYHSIKQSMSHIGAEIDKMKLEKVSNELLSKYILDEIHSGLIAFDEENAVKLVNRRALNFFDISSLSRLSDLDKRHPGLARKLNLLSPSGTSVIEFPFRDALEKFHFSANELFVMGKYLKVVVFTNIQKELESIETESYLRLIRILIHEINNSLTPITSLALANKEILKDGRNTNVFAKLNPDDLGDLISNNEVLEERSVGIRNFVSQFSQLTNIPDPSFSEIIIEDVFKKIHTICKPQLKEEEIEFQTVSNPGNLAVRADKGMLTQVLINLVKNSINALKDKEDGRVMLSAYLVKNQVVIEVRDNGLGIDQDLLNKIFIPFFTTRENGSGIGLSYSRQVMQLHGGTIKVKSVPLEETTFELAFPAGG